MDFYELYKSLRHVKVVGANKCPTRKEISLSLSGVLNHTASSTKRATRLSYYMSQCAKIIKNRKQRKKLMRSIPINYIKP